MLRENRDEIGWLLHRGPFADLGRPQDFLRASLEALDRGGPFPGGAGQFDAARRVLALEGAGGFAASRSVIGRAAVGQGAVLSDSVVWDGAAIGDGAAIHGCLVAGGRVPGDARHTGVLLWPGSDGLATPHPLG
jgi:NDP-sugar pyrophosphorylase family protein